MFGMLYSIKALVTSLGSKVFVDCIVFLDGWMDGWNDGGPCAS